MPSLAQLRCSSLSVLGIMKICCHFGFAEAMVGMMVTNLLFGSQVGGYAWE
jgi:hypothetical protein